MSVLIGSWEFEGPLVECAAIEERPAIVAFLAYKDSEWELLDLLETNSAEDLAFELSTDQSLQDDSDSLGFAVYYCDDLTPPLQEGLLEKIMQEVDQLVEPTTASKAVQTRGN